MGTREVSGIEFSDILEEFVRWEIGIDPRCTIDDMSFEEDNYVMESEESDDFHISDNWEYVNGEMSYFYEGKLFAVKSIDGDSEEWDFTDLAINMFKKHIMAIVEKRIDDTLGGFSG